MEDANMTWLRHAGQAIVAGSLIISPVMPPVLAAESAAFHYDGSSVRPATYYASITNLANAVMFSGLGETLIFSPYERDDWLRRSGYVARPPMPDMGIVGVLYRSGRPEFAGAPDFAKPETLRWKTDGVDKTLDPGAQAWALLKITSPEFHLQFHDLPENKIAALMMLPQARALARALAKRLRTPEHLFAPRRVDGGFMTPKPRDQAAVLWAASSFVLAAISPRATYWHKAYRDLTNVDDARRLADQAFAAVAKLGAKTPADRAITIAALGRYALMVEDKVRRRAALDRARLHADALVVGNSRSLQDIALAVFGLTEAGRLLHDASFGKTAARIFAGTLAPLWDEPRGLFKLPGNSKTIDYDPETVGAVVAALNAMRWYGSGDLKTSAARLYPRFFENAIIRSGLLQGSPLALVSAKYRKQHPAAQFAHPALPKPKATGIAPVFASKASFEGGRWRVTDRTFRTASSMFLANMLAIANPDGRNDLFLPSDLLKGLGL